MQSDPGGRQILSERAAQAPRPDHQDPRIEQGPLTFDAHLR